MHSRFSIGLAAVGLAATLGAAGESPSLPVPAGADGPWLETASRAIAAAEYHASASATGLQAPNRAQGFRTCFENTGITVVPRQAAQEKPAWRFQWRLARWGRPGRMAAVDPVAPATEGARITYARPGLREWYENTAKGLEQGFEVSAAPAGGGTLCLEGTVGDGLRAELDAAGGAVDFRDVGGARVLRYADLHVRDAAGREIPARLAVAGDALSIQIDDAGAAYPLLVDPLMTSPAWTAESDQAVASFGLSVATAGDVNGDGFSDVIVGAYLFDNGETDEGRAFVYQGSVSGLSLTPSWIAEGDQIGAQFGFSVATAGDVNGDGFSDVIVGAIRYDNGETDEGRAYVYQGSASGLSLGASWTAESDQANAFFGLPVATAGDVNGDGFSDVIVGAFQYDNGESDEGRAFVYHGSAGGLSLAANWTAESDQAGAWFGNSVGTAGDVNGDGFADVVVGAYHYSNGQTNEGRAFVYQGSASGLATSPAWTAESEQANAEFGWSVATAGDVNGDGFADVIVGADRYDNGQTNEGRAFVYQGAAAGLATTPAWTEESDQTSALFGVSVATAGDVNGDGFADVIVGANGFDNGQTDEGRAFVYQGSAAGLATSPVWTTESDQASAFFGYSVATAGDVNGDGYSDVIVGAYQYDNGELNEGRAFVYHGSANGLSLTPNWTAEGDQASANFGFSVATAGDVNGDGFSDVIVGAPNYDNGEADEGRAYVYHGSAGGLATSPAWTAESEQANAEFGWSVATAGDVNGDGFTDVIVGAAGYDNGETDEGRAFVYHGSAGGLNPTPNWTAESNQAGPFFGNSVAAAGDVNGDGFSDVIVGAHLFDNGEADEGQAFVYHGSANGLSLAANWTAERDQANAKFGFSVATAGDVNGDGFSDVIVGAYYFDNGQTDEGRAFVYQGSAAGLATSPAWTAESDQASARFGNSVAAAGDVNGDGFSDVIVGAYLFDNGEAAEGRAFVYHGSGGGLNPTPNWTAESNQAGPYFGGPVATAGDVNGDGFSDVIIGAPFFDDGELDEGRAFVYYGNEGDGLDRIARQARTDDSAPISLLGTSDSESAFRLKALGRTAAGRGRVRLQFEVKPAGIPFDGTGLVTGPAIDTGTPGGTGSVVPLSELASGLAPETLYHWRLRIVTDSPFFPRSPWLTLPGNSRTEADLRTASPPAGIGSEGEPAARLALLEPVRPNPLLTHGEIAYTLPEAGQVRLTVVDVVGRVRAVLADGSQAAGRHTARWDGRDAGGNALPAGVYLLRLEAAGLEAARKLVINH